MTRTEALALGRVLAAVVAEVRERLRYCGEYDPGRTYRPGNFVSHGGSVWHCDSECKDVAPAPDSPHWTCAVKRGKDA